ncbi:hypothetical protein [Nocardia sp. NPDC051570]|uniref:hypothetical protein n=1 Tax=Nocardia sp. NPDC051570 TaxID=3364324 RepID=UPI0037AC4EEE
MNDTTANPNRTGDLESAPGERNSTSIPNVADSLSDDMYWEHADQQQHATNRSIDDHLTVIPPGKPPRLTPPAAAALMRLIRHVADTQANDHNNEQEAA